MFYFDLIKNIVFLQSFDLFHQNIHIVIFNNIIVNFFFFIFHIFLLNEYIKCEIYFFPYIPYSNFSRVLPNKINGLLLREKRKKNLAHCGY